MGGLLMEKETNYFCPVLKKDCVNGDCAWWLGDNPDLDVVACGAGCAISAIAVGIGRIDDLGLEVWVENKK